MAQGLEVFGLSGYLLAYSCLTAVSLIWLWHEVRAYESAIPGHQLEPQKRLYDGAGTCGATWLSFSAWGVDSSLCDG
jgi:hypothetical protein